MGREPQRRSLDGRGTYVYGFPRQVVHQVILNDFVVDLVDSVDARISSVSQQRQRDGDLRSREVLGVALLRAIVAVVEHLARECIDAPGVVVMMLGEIVGQDFYVCYRAKEEVEGVWCALQGVAMSGWRWFEDGKKVTTYRS